MRTQLSSVIACSLIFWIIGCQSPKSSEESDPTRPNIIYIMADDLGYGDLGSYGQKEIQTPHLDRMAAQGIRFTQHYAGSTVCAPTRCSLMTGLHQGHAKVRGNAKVPLTDQDTTVAEILKANGYRTGLIGKWGLGEAGSTGMPNKKGFDYFFGYLSQVRAHNYYPDYLWQNEEKYPLDNEVQLIDDTTYYAYGTGFTTSVKRDYSHDFFTTEALKFIKESADGPFFLYLAYTIPHANNESRFVGEHGMEVPDLGLYQDKDWTEPQKGHAAMISRMDSDIGKILDELADLGIDENTVVLFTSDNGPHREGGNDPEFNQSSGPLRGIKRDLYEGGIRVPLIVRWPGTIRANATSDHISAFWDFLATACDLARVDPPRNIDGVSFLPTLTGQHQKAHDYLYWEFFEQGGKKAIRKNNWKAIQLNVSHPDSSYIELYDLSQDLGETNNIADLNPGLVAEFSTLMQEARTESEYFKFKTPR